MTHTIVFVDDDPNVLNSLKRGLRPYRKQWKTHFCESAETAIEIFKQTPVDVLVTDIRMPNKDGVALMEDISQLQPETIRIALSGQVEEQQFHKIMVMAHQFLSKPCSTESLVDTLNKACSLPEYLDQARSSAYPIKFASLPSPPALFNELQTILKDPDIDAHKIAALIIKDTVLTAKLLQMVNSPYFNIEREIDDVTEAALYVGVDSLTTIITAYCLANRYAESAHMSAEIQYIFNQGSAIACLAKRLCAAEGHNKRLQNQAFTIGLLLPIGRLSLFSSYAAPYKQAIEQATTENTSLLDVEDRVFCYNHLKVAAYMLTLWGLPKPTIEILALPFAVNEPSENAQILGPIVHASYQLIQHSPHVFSDEAFAQLLTRFNGKNKVEDWKNVYDNSQCQQD